jgi:A/G-specific adenine glycosylase
MPNGRPVIIHERTGPYPRSVSVLAIPPPELLEAILAWYGEQGRPLAFRRTTDPYAILVSEAMAQQTQAARAAERWERFMERFPTVASLAIASPADVLREWQGLGYDRRGLNLWRAAGVIVATHGGRVPSDLAALEALPGVGPYTARAVAALAFGAAVGAVDTNVRRVLGRIVAGDPSALTAREMQGLADAIVPPDQPGLWTHALMDLGATICRAAKADCPSCPARPWCRFAAAGSAIARAPRAARERAAPFTSTNRWLRGRILDRLRTLPEAAWTTIDGALGDHAADAVDRALDALAADGLIESEWAETAGNGPGARRVRLRMA